MSASTRPSPSGTQRLGDTVDVILYYKYFDHELNEEEQLALVEAQEELCSRLGLRGRVRVATEGINGTLGGDAAAVVDRLPPVALERQEPATA